MNDPILAPCDGCSERVPTAMFDARFQDEPETVVRVRYCDECYQVAEDGPDADQGAFASSDCFSIVPVGGAAWSYSDGSRQHGSFDDLARDGMDYCVNEWDNGGPKWDDDSVRAFVTVEVEKDGVVVGRSTERTEEQQAVAAYRVEQHLDAIEAANAKGDALRDLLAQLDGIGIPDWHGAEGLSLTEARRLASVGTVLPQPDAIGALDALYGLIMELDGGEHEDVAAIVAARDVLVAHGRLVLADEDEEPDTFAYTDGDRPKDDDHRWPACPECGIANGFEHTSRCSRRDA